MAVKKTMFFLVIFLSPLALGSATPVNPEAPSSPACNKALGMESSAISDKQISSSSHQGHHAAQRGRLHFNVVPGKVGSWSARVLDSNQWLQVDLGSRSDTKLTGVATQGGTNFCNRRRWVTKYKLQYSDDGVNFQYYKDQGSPANEKEFVGNIDRDSVVYHDLNPPITARYIRFRPTAWTNRISLRVELYGCQVIKACDSSPCLNGGTCFEEEGGNYTCQCNNRWTGKRCDVPRYSCDAIKRTDSGESAGNFTIYASSSTLQVYCAGGWTLVARFSNSDAKNWMDDTGSWWYDRNVAFGSTTDPSSNADMISPAFWLVSGKEFKITRSDDSQHTALLQTTGDCLGNQTFRSKITSYGDFRNGAIWAKDKCLGSCTVQYGGQYQTTEGFTQVNCDGEIQSAKSIGFWCAWSVGDGAVLMIGGGGTKCARADHGIGITEANAASFNDDSTAENDFGNEADIVVTNSYSLNLWIR